MSTAHPLQRVANQIAARTDEIMHRREIGSFDEHEVDIRLDELSAIMAFTVDLLRAEVAEQ